MRRSARRGISALLAGGAAIGLLSFAQDVSAQARPDDDDDEARAPLTEIVVTAQRLDAARADVERSLGASSYTLSNAVVENRPGGESANLVHVLLQMPGVAQGAGGEVNVRAQAGLQYRINNILVPDGFSDLAETLRARFADKVELVTGALPAQYGLQVGGVVNITTKNGVYQHGGEAEAYGGSHGRRETAFEAAGGAGGANAYASASYLHDDAGLASVDGAAHPRHDRTDQVDGFAFVDHIIDAQSRASLIAGLSDDRSELPDRTAGLQHSRTAYGILSYQRSRGPLTYQVAGSARYSALRIGDGPRRAALGPAESVFDHSLAAGLQAEGLYDLGAAHRLRAGGLFTFGRDRNETAYGVAPLTARSSGRRAAGSLFAQDEWRALGSVTVNYGVRFDSVTGEGGGDLIGPRLNAVWDVAPGTRAHAGFARYLAPAPEAQEAGWPAVPIGGSPARAETDNYFDVGLEQVLGDLRIAVDAYWRDATDLLDEARVDSSSLRRPFNFAEGRVRGVEFNGAYADGPLTAWANLALARAEGRRIASGTAAFTPAQLAGAADRFVATNQDQAVTASLGVSYHWRAFRTSADATYASGLPRTAPGGDVNGSRLPGHVEVNLSVVYRLDGLEDRPLDLRFDVTNLGDARYRLQDGTSLAGGPPQWGPRRGLALGLEQQF